MNWFLGQLLLLMVITGFTLIFTREYKITLRRIALRVAIAYAVVHLVSFVLNGA